MSVSVRDTALEKIPIRSWDDLRDEWLSIAASGSLTWPLPIPTVGLFSLSSLDLVLSRLRTQSTEGLQVVSEPIEGLYEAMLLESVVLLRKSAHVLAAAVEEGRLGYRTWCRSSCYQSAFFAAKGVVGLLGVTADRTTSGPRDDWQIDLFSAERKHRRLLEPAFDVGMVKVGRKVAHKEWWARLVRTYCGLKHKPAEWPNRACDILRKLSPEDFARQRGLVHYRPGWLFDDLENLVTMDDFTHLERDSLSGQPLEDVGHADFSSALAVLVLGLGVRLLTDLGRSDSRFTDEAARLKPMLTRTDWTLCSILP